MTKATVNGTVIAESDSTVVVEGNHYFPSDSIKKEFFSEFTDLKTVCGWKGTARYADITVGGNKMDNAAWTYPEPLAGAKNIKGHWAFYKAKGITIE
eukprot:TRINITY_DN6323_c0_g1_i1.p2 TRINITY_DN6323_c0_g1~~TRINITY_DN6323_c0_g1_i1.p2  ORF type:complete len:107 (+),score=18.24 TRINITY_DN6323_c0_g1_i1:32-322(+)